MLDKTKATNADPIFAAIEKYKRADKLCIALHTAFDDAEEAIDGHAPFSLIAWRNYSAIGGSEIERARDEFLSTGAADPETIEREYQDAKARYLARREEMERWYQEHGIFDLWQRSRKSVEAIWAARAALVMTAPTTLTGLAAYLNFITSHMDRNDDERPFVDDETGAFVRAMARSVNMIEAA